jgi:hypothetical protein
MAKEEKTVFPFMIKRAIAKLMSAPEKMLLKGNRNFLALEP